MLQLNAEQKLMARAAVLCLLLLPIALSRWMLTTLTAVRGPIAASGRMRLIEFFVTPLDLSRWVWPISAGNRWTECNSCRCTSLAGGREDGHQAGTASAGSPLMRRRKDFTMRLAKVSLLAVSVSMTLSGCAAYRGATQSVTPEPESLTLPPRHAQEYHPPRSYQDPDGGPENTESNSPHAPIQPPPVPPAFGVSRVKSVGFIRDLGAKVSGPFQGRSSESAAAAGCAPPVACTDEGCKSTDDRRPGCCLVRALKKSRSICSVWKNAHRRYSPCADADVSSPCIPQDDACGRVISSACGDVFAGDLPGLIAPGECCGRGLCAPRPGWASGCGPASRDSAGCMPTGPGGLQRPCLSDSLSDPFLDPQNRAGSSWPGVSPAPPQRPFHEPTEGSSDTVPPGVVPAPPTPDEADRRSDALPLWPRLEREQPEGEQRVRAAQASLRYSDRAATRAEDLRLPQIIPRPTH